MGDAERPGSQAIGPTGIPSAEAFGEPTLWLTHSFAPEWLTDAMREAQFSGLASRRREIVFAVCAIEAYLIEWVRDDVLHGDLRTLSHYFPQKRRLGVRDRWKAVCKQLAADGRIPAAPDWGGAIWHDFDELVKYRDGLVHARASRPETAGLEEGEMPFPTLTQLAAKQPGWASQIVVSLILHLHAAVGSPPPHWLQAP